MTHGATDPTHDDVSLFAIVDLGEEMVFARDALGHREHVTIGGIGGALETPSLPDWAHAPDDPLHEPLIAPMAARTWKRGDVPIYWGRPCAYPAGLARPQAALIEFIVPASKLRDHSASVSRTFSTWHSSFVDFYELLTKQPLHASQIVSSHSEALDLFVWGDGKHQVRPYEQEPIVLQSSMPSEREVLNRANLSEICKLCSIGSRPSLHYRVQLQAYRAVRERDYRKAVIESAVAAEIVLTEAIGKHFQSTGLTYGEKIMEKFRMLGGRLKLAEIVGLSLPDIDFQKAVVDPRNQAIHRGKFFERIDAFNVVVAVDQLLNVLAPRRDEQI
jgi:hypothetical protein